MLKKQNNTQENISVINKRKSEHVEISLNKETEPNRSPFAKYRLPFRALPEIDLKDVDCSTDLLGYKLQFPFIVSSMTGGPEFGKNININLAKACELAGCGLGLGSMRVMLRDPESLQTFDVKKYCPNIPLFANFGLVQLNYGYGAKEINKIIDNIKADAIFLHVNALQEAVQPEGDTNFSDLLNKLAKVLPHIQKPVFIKEVGTGIDFKTAKALTDIGIKWIDVSGLGGTSWSTIEAYRRHDEMGFPLGELGIYTDDAIQTCANIDGLNIIAGGGIRNGIDIAKSLMLGAKLATAAKPFLKPATLNKTGVSECVNILNDWKQQLRISMFTMGTRNLSELHRQELICPFDK